MKRIVLFSTPTNSNIYQISDLIFPKEIEHKVFAYMPSSGSNSPQKYTDFWKGIADKFNAEFNFIDNTNSDKSQKKALLKSNILLITGGNTFGLLNNLRQSGLDQTIKEFSKKDNIVLAGFSAGAIVLSPTIEVCNLPGYDENLVRLTNLNGLNIINFEVFPHFNEDSERQVLEKYRAQTKYQVKEITDEGHISLDL